MQISITSPFAANSNAASNDTRQIKKALNKLGYYFPYAETGLTDFPDAAIFESIRQFQRDYKLPVSGEIKPDDKTVEEINRQLANDKEGYYIWRTTGDGKVRRSHTALNHTIRAWSDSPDPGDDFGCRCWGEKISISTDMEKSFQDVLNKLTSFRKHKFQLSSKLLQHYLGKTGEAVILDSNELNDSAVVRAAIDNNRTRFEDDFLGQIKIDDANSFYQMVLALPDKGRINVSDYWDVDRQKTDFGVLMDTDFARSIGSGKIRSTGDFEVSRKGNIIVILGHVVHSIDDRYDFNDDTWIDRGLFDNERELAKKGYAKPFDIHWEKADIFRGGDAAS